MSRFLFSYKIAIFAILMICTGVIVCTPAPAQAKVICSSWYRNGHNLPIQECTAGIPKFVASRVLENTQLESEWCWAATIANVFAYYGHPVDQRRIVQVLYGRLLNKPAKPEAIAAVINRRWVDAYGRRFTAHGTFYHRNFGMIARDLAANHPAIVGTLGHAMIISALTYMRQSNGSGYVKSAVVRDPWPKHLNRRVLTTREWNNIFMLLRVQVD